MKGIVFTEFLEMVEKEFGFEMVDHLITNSDLPSSGIYTSVGTYHHSEMVELLTNLSVKSEIAPNVLLKAFGKYLFNTFLGAYPQFFSEVDNAFDFLESIDKHIHVEVKKLYPDAALPKFETEENDQGQMIMTYMSERKLSDLAEGLIENSVEHYGKPYHVSKENLKEDGSVVKFTITPVE